MDIIDAFFKNNLGELQGNAKRKRRRVAASQELGELHGVKLAPSFARLVDLLGEIDSDRIFGAFGAFAAPDWLPGRANALTHALEEPFRRSALLTGTVALGPNGAGDTWLFALEPRSRRHEVFVLGHDTMELHPIADSVEVFLYVQHVLEHGATPTPADVKALRGRVQRAPDVDVDLPASLRGFRPASPVAKRLASASDSLAALDFFRADDLPGPAARQTPTAGVPDLVTAMLRSFLRLDDEVLGQLVAQHRDHKARLIRDAAKLLGGDKSLDQRSSALDRSASTRSPWSTVPAIRSVPGTSLP